MRTINATILPSECWIHENKRILYNGINPLPDLPWIASDKEHILKENNIPYRKYNKKLYVYSEETMEICEYWSPELYEEYELTLPLYARIPGKGMRYAKNHTEKVITKETAEAALKTKQFVDKKLREYREQLFAKDMYEMAQKELNGGTARCVRLQKEITPLRNNPTYEVEFDGNKFKFVRIPYFIIKNSYHMGNWVLIFNMNTVPTNGYVTLKVPKQIAGIVIGKAASSISAIAKEIGVKKIWVIES